MAGLDDLYARIPTSEIANNLGADEGEVDSAIRTLVPVLLTDCSTTAKTPSTPARLNPPRVRRPHVASSTQALVR